MLFKIAIFILFLGPLVFFHELGHFLFARLFRVRVEVFSIGFGPKLLQKKWGDTVYAFSLIPLGGYVKMFGEDILNKEDIPAEQRQHSFAYKGKWARFWIVFGGPLANFIFAAALFFTLSLVGERAPEMRLGVVSHYSSLYSLGFRSADVLQKVNGFTIHSPVDFPIEQFKQVKEVVVLRGKQEVAVKVNWPITKFFKQFMQITPLLRSPLVVDDQGQRWAVSRYADKVDTQESLDILAEEQLPTIYLYPVTSATDKQGHFKYDKSRVQRLVVNGYLLATLMANHYYPIDIQVKSISMGSAADKAQLQAGDLVVALNRHPTYSFEDLRTALANSKEQQVELLIRRKGQDMTIKLTPQVKQIGGKPVKLIGVYSAGEFLAVKFVDLPGKTLGASAQAAISRTYQAIVKTLAGFKKLLTAQVSLKSVGGPLAIGKVAADSFATSLSYFFQIMALISVNLGIINLFPIPVLDGGHIVFIFFELINRGPLSRRKLEIAQQFGLSILLVLMMAAIFNDFSRFVWG